MKRGRNQRRRPGGGNSNPNRALDSNGPEVRIRGTATQIYDKYTALARDAASAGDRIKAESYLQHAEHYFRVIRATQPAQQPQQGQQSQSQPNQSGQSQPSSRDGDDEQPTIEGSDDAPKGRQNNQRDRRRQEAAPSPEATGDTETPVLVEANSDAGEKASASDAAEPEKKPKRRRAPRRPKAESADGDAPKSDAKSTAATAAE